MSKQTRFSVAFLLALSGITISFDSFGANTSEIQKWIVNKMVVWSPPGRSLLPSAKETPEEGIARYNEIANSIVSVVYDKNEKSIFSGKIGRARTAAIIASVAFHESNFRKDVDLNIGNEARGDSGRSWCMMQVMMGLPVGGNTRTRVRLTEDSFEFTSDKSDWGGTELVQDRTKCFRVGLRMIRKSFSSCSRSPLLDRLAIYASGKSCHDGIGPSRTRIGRAVQWIALSPPPMDDDEVIGSDKPLEFPIPTQEQSGLGFDKFLFGA